MLERANKTLSEYLSYMKDQPLEWYEQVDETYSWIFPQMQRIQVLLQAHKGVYCTQAEKSKQKRTARITLDTFILKFQKIYLSMNPHVKQPSKYWKQMNEPIEDFYTRFIDAAKKDTKILGITYLAHADSFPLVKKALKDYVYYTNAPEFPRNDYDEILALNKSLLVFLPLIKKIQVPKNKKAKQKQLPDFIRALLKREL